MTVIINEAIFVGGGALSLVFGVFKIDERKKFLESGIRVRGEVIDVEKKYDNEGDLSYYPIIQYSTLENELIETTYSIGTNPPMYKIGSKLSILYDQDDHYHMMIDNTFSKIIGPLLIVFGGGLMICAAYYFI